MVLRIKSGAAHDWTVQVWDYILSHTTTGTLNVNFLSSKMHIYLTMRQCTIQIHATLQINLKVEY